MTLCFVFFIAWVCCFSCSRGNLFIFTCQAVVFFSVFSWEQASNEPHLSLIRHQNLLPLKSRHHLLPCSWRCLQMLISKMFLALFCLIDLPRTSSYFYYAFPVDVLCVLDSLILLSWQAICFSCSLPFYKRFWFVLAFSCFFLLPASLVVIC